MSYLGVLILLGLLIVVHELGHLVAARLAGIPVAGFSVGFGPRLWSRQWGQVECSLRALPLGGFVEAGLDDFEFREIPLGRRLAFFLGGPLANLAVCLPLLAARNVMEQGFSLYQSIVAPFGQVAAACWRYLSLLASVFTGPESLSGVVAIVIEGGRLAQAGMALELALSLSIALAVLNLLPLPILDGGQIIMSSMEKVFPRLIRLRIPLTLSGLVFLAGLMVYVNIRDVAHYWGA
jgi:regulator of sigma E protease